MGSSIKDVCTEGKGFSNKWTSGREFLIVCGRITDVHILVGPPTSDFVNSGRLCSISEY